MPGTYSISMALSQNGKYEILEENIPFTIKLINEKETTGIKSIAFRKEIHETTISILESVNDLQKLNVEIQKLKQKHLLSQVFLPELKSQIITLEKTLSNVDLKLNGHKPKASPEEVPPHKKSVRSRLDFLVWGVIETNMAPSSNHMESLKIITKEYLEIVTEMEAIKAEIDEIDNQLQ